MTLTVFALFIASVLALFAVAFYIVESIRYELRMIVSLFLSSDISEGDDCL